MTASSIYDIDHFPNDRPSYKIIDSESTLDIYFTSLLTLFVDLLRVIRKGPTVKRAVDDAIDQCSEVFNLRDSIEESRVLAEQATDEQKKKSYAQRGVFSPDGRRQPWSLTGEFQACTT